MVPATETAPQEFLSISRGTTRKQILFAPGVSSGGVLVDGARGPRRVLTDVVITIRDIIVGPPVLWMTRQVPREAKSLLLSGPVGVRS